MNEFTFEILISDADLVGNSFIYIRVDSKFPE